MTAAAERNIIVVREARARRELRQLLRRVNRDDSIVVVVNVNRKPIMMVSPAYYATLNGASPL